MSFDAIVIGGSYAGLSAALQLARARRKVLIMDSGLRRNRFAEHSHGFLGQDGRTPGAIAADARAQLMAYPTVEWVDATATDGSGEMNDFTVSAESGECYQARRIILAAGVVDALPDLPGLAERWGKHVFHCPYCHGYELDQGRIGVLASSEMSMHHALMLPDWGSTTLFLNGAFTPDADQLMQLMQRGVTVEREPIRQLSGASIDIELTDGRIIPLDGMFTLTRTSLASPLGTQLGCAVEDGPMGPFLQTDMFKETTVSGVFACGDMARATGSVALAVGDGAMAGVGAHRSLMFGPGHA
ncbi:NAD(P)/FAD-dependent oxidoreductase [Tardiphaga sp. P9-11]|jgi:thioredoxin reductase|uniref:NAD(P)/FAD-dependent oxidoreductase n=1 Tax=Tardiphaga sp. P9-11 TaxID=2024614 RepID=UPI0011F0C9D2|nr:NAD(P)/FAD-dependent oxidoreductase [Tardiphaga sp. P9-11]KAA0075396.1 NAD(P)/FAD-dependent oxidoreductase [Tardiphaga sp. P9-11]